MTRLGKSLVRISSRWIERASMSRCCGLSPPTLSLHEEVSTNRAVRDGLLRTLVETGEVEAVQWIESRNHNASFCVGSL